jgi:hypothetical protein
MNADLSELPEKSPEQIKEEFLQWLIQLPAAGRSR